MIWLYAVQFAGPLFLVAWMLLVLTGNHVMLRCAAADVLLGHLQQGSVAVRAGANVAAGDWLGSVGNSGNTGEAHLYVHAQTRGTTADPFGGDPRPIQFNGRFPVRGDRIEAS